MPILEAITAAVAGAGAKKVIENATRKPRGASRRAKPKKEKDIERSIAAAIMRSGKRADGDDPALEEFREELFAEMKKLIPDAIRQAKGSQRKPPRPALLRILTRFGR